MKPYHFAVAFMAIYTACAQVSFAQTLGGGEGPDISIWRVLLALLFCLLVGLLVIWFLHARQMGGKAASKSLLKKFSLADKATHVREIEIIDMRKLNPHFDACLVRCRGQEYFILLGTQGATILSDSAVSRDGERAADSHAQ